MIPTPSFWSRIIWSTKIWFYIITLFCCINFERRYFNIYQPVLHQILYMAVSTFWLRNMPKFVLIRSPNSVLFVKNYEQLFWSSSTLPLRLWNVLYGLIDCQTSFIRCKTSLASKRAKVFGNWITRCKVSLTTPFYCATSYCDPSSMQLLWNLYDTFSIVILKRQKWHQPKTLFR